MVWGAVIGAAGSLIGGALANRSRERNADEANELSREIARERMAFDERMSSTAHQREVDDLRAAGLNPILSSHGGASSPSGATAQVFTPEVQDFIGDAARTGVSTAMAGERLETEIDKMKQEVNESRSREDVNKDTVPQIKANTALLRTQGDLTAQNWYNAAQQSDLIKEQIGKTAEEKSNAFKLGKILDEQVHSAQRAAEADKARAEFYRSPAGKFITKLGTGARELNPFMGSTNSALDMLRGK